MHNSAYPERPDPTLCRVKGYASAMSKATANLGSEPSSDIELAGSVSVDLEPANVTSSGQRSANQKKYLVSGIPTDPLFFKKGKKKKKKKGGGGGGRGFQMASCSYALFLQRQFRLYAFCRSVCFCDSRS